MSNHIKINAIQKHTFPIYSTPSFKLWFKTLLALTFIIDLILFITNQTNRIISLSIFGLTFFFMINLVLCKVKEHNHWKKAYKEFSKITGIYHIPLSDFKEMGNRILKDNIRHK